MEIGIKYCGGCNSQYDRVQAVKLLQQACPEHRYSYVSDGSREKDIWIVVCGCPAGCASTEGLISRRHLFLITNEEDLKAAAIQLQSMQQT